MSFWSTDNYFTGDNVHWKKGYIHQLSFTCILFALWMSSPIAQADETTTDDNDQEKIQTKRIEPRTNLVKLLDAMGRDMLKATTLALTSNPDFARLSFAWPNTPFQKDWIQKSDKLNAVLDYKLCNGVVKSQRIYVFSNNRKLYDRLLLKMQKNGNRIPQKEGNNEIGFVIKNDNENESVQVFITPFTEEGWTVDYRNFETKRLPAENVPSKREKENVSFEVFGAPVLLGVKSKAVSKLLNQWKWFPYRIFLEKGRMYINDKYIVYNTCLLSSSTRLRSREMTHMNLLTLELHVDSRLDVESNIDEAKAVHQLVNDTLKSKCISGTTVSSERKNTIGETGIQLEGSLRGNTHTAISNMRLYWETLTTHSWFVLYVDLENKDAP